MWHNDAMSEIPKEKMDLTEVGRALSYEIDDTEQGLNELRAQYEQLPRGVLVELAWRAIAHYHSHGVATRVARGHDNTEIERLERIKNQRLAALTAEERRLAIAEANLWLDENFAE